MIGSSVTIGAARFEVRSETPEGYQGVVIYPGNRELPFSFSKQISLEKAAERVAYAYSAWNGGNAKRPAREKPEA